MAGYAEVHRNLSATYGKSSTYVCTFCHKNPAVAWAYDHGDADELTDDAGRVFSTDMLHYIPLCGSCHGKLDFPYRHPQGDWAGPNVLRPSQRTIYHMT